MKPLTWCSPVCSLDCCHLSGSKLPGWNTVYTDRRDYRALDREAIWTHWMGSSSMTLPWQLVDETNCDCSMFSLTPHLTQSNTFIQDRTFKCSVYTLIFSWTLEPWGSLKNTHAIHRVVISMCWRTVNANYKLIHKPAINVQTRPNPRRSTEYAASSDEIRLWLDDTDTAGEAQWGQRSSKAYAVGEALRPTLTCHHINDAASAWQQDAMGCNSNGQMGQRGESTRGASLSQDKNYTLYFIIWDMGQSSFTLSVQQHKVYF